MWGKECLNGSYPVDQGELWYLFYGTLPRSDYSCLPKSEVNIQVLCMGHGLQMLLDDLCVFLVPKVYKYFIAVQAEQCFWNFHYLVSLQYLVYYKIYKRNCKAS